MQSSVVCTPTICKKFDARAESSRLLFSAGEAIPTPLYDKVMDSIDVNNPDDLRDAVHIVVGIGFKLRGGADHVDLTFEHIEFDEDEDGKKRLRCCPSFLKNHSDDKSRLESRYLYQLDPDDPKDEYNLVKKYCDKQPVGQTGRFYRPNKSKSSKQQSRDGEGVAWYKSGDSTAAQYGVNSIKGILKRRCAQVGMAAPSGGLGKWIPHSLRRTGLTNMYNGGRNLIQMMASGGHTTVAGMRPYCVADANNKLLNSAASFGAQKGIDKAVTNFSKLSSSAAVDGSAPAPAGLRAMGGDAGKVPLTPLPPSLPVWAPTTAAQQPSTPVYLHSAEAPAPAVINRPVKRARTQVSPPTTGFAMSSMPSVQPQHWAGGPWIPQQVPQPHRSSTSFCSLCGQEYIAGTVSFCSRCGCTLY